MKTLAFLGILLSCTTTVVPQTDPILIKCGKLVDGKEGIALEHAFILVDRGKIVKVGTDRRLPNDVQLIDLSGLTVLPGLIDAHGVVVPAGSIERGKPANIIAVEGDLLKETGNSRNIVFVMKNGWVVLPWNGHK